MHKFYKMGKFFRYYNKYEDFASQKLSITPNNNSFIIGPKGVETTGTPDVSYNMICWIADIAQIWTHGQFWTLTQLSENFDELKENYTLDSQPVIGDSIEEAIAKLSYQLSGVNDAIENILGE